MLSYPERYQLVICSLKGLELRVKAPSIEEEGQSMSGLEEYRSMQVDDEKLNHFF